MYKSLLKIALAVAVVCSFIVLISATDASAQRQQLQGAELLNCERGTRVCKNDDTPLIHCRVCEAVDTDTNERHKGRKCVKKTDDYDDDDLDEDAMDNAVENCKKSKDLNGGGHGGGTFGAR